MSFFTDYIQRTRPQQTYVAASLSQQPTTQPQPQQPQITPPADGNYIGWMKDMLGPTPAEREAQERRLAENKAKMAGWAGLFQGLGALGDLYYASKGATPVRATYNPQQQIEQNYQQERQRLDDLYKNRQAYATMLYNIHRQGEEDRRKNAVNAAQLKWYDTRDEVARMKAENDRLKNEQAIATQKARQLQIEAKTRQMDELHPLQRQKLEAVIKNTLHNANRPYGRSGSGGRGTGSSDPFAELATQLNDNPDVIGPILQQEGLGLYDPGTKEFTFSKNATKGMATTAVRRARNTSTHTRSGGTNNSGFFN